jgi:hypothetical protein
VTVKIHCYSVVSVISVIFALYPDPNSMANTTLIMSVFEIEVVDMKAPKLDLTSGLVGMFFCCITFFLVCLVQVRLHYFLQSRNDRTINRIIRSSQVRELAKAIFIKHYNCLLFNKFPSDPWDLVPLHCSGSSGTLGLIITL